MSNLIGQVLADRYRVDAFLGRGGMAEVYKVWDNHRMTDLAMKLLYEDLAIDRVFLRRFKREAQTLARLQHPNIVRFYGLEQDARLAFILMEFVEGETLKQKIFDAAGPLNYDQISTIFRPVCGALQYAHHEGLVHCDLKPGNIMVHKSGNILVTDFGIARMTDAATMTMVGMGTPAYMAPEQARGLDPTPQTDIYTLGIVLYEMLTGGERPFTGERARTTGTTSEKVRWEQVHLEPTSPREYNPVISPNLEAVVLTCLKKKPAERYPNILTFLEDLERALTKGGVPVVKDMEPIEELKPPAQELEPEPEIAAAAGPEISEVYSQEEAAPSVQRPSREIWRQPWLWIAGLVTLSLIIVGFFAVQDSRLINFSSSPPTQTSRTAAESPLANRTQIYFDSNREGKMEIFHLDSDGQVRRITRTPGDAESVQPVPSSGGGLYFTSNRQGKLEVHFMNANGQIIRITKTPGAAESFQPVPAAGGGLYFTSNRDGKLEIYHLDGEGATTRITKTAEHGESFEPIPTVNGGLYFTSTRDAKLEIYHLNDHGEISRVTRTPGDGESFEPHPAINGGLYFTSNRDGKREIYYLDKDGGTSQITRTAGEGESMNPLPTVNGGLYFISNRDGKPEIYFMNKEGKISRVTRSPGPSFSLDPAPVR